MKAQSLIFSTILASALASPAIVWKNSRGEDAIVQHSSQSLKASDLLTDALTPEASDSSLAAVVFLLGKGEDGSESLTELASSGKLPGTASRFDNADAMYYHVSGVESTDAMLREAKRANSGHRVLKVNLSEFNRKLTSLGQPTKVEMEVTETGVVSKVEKHTRRKERDLAASSVLLVNVSAKEASELDSAVLKAIEHKSVENVVLAGIRSLNEVKHERYLLSKKRMHRMEQAGDRMLQAKRRRLEQEEEEGDEDADNGDDMSGVYYVSMTPNILAGLLFGLLFTVVTWIGISCMGAIAGQDVYVSKMPTIGREA